MHSASKSDTQLNNNVNGKKMKQCNRCLMDTSISNVSINTDGNCNLCTDFLAHYTKLLDKGAANTEALLKLAEKIKEDGKGKKYDCIVGVSGGVDSSWALVKAVELGLRPLAVHMDNGWNTELANNNITHLIEKLNVDLYTYTLEPEEYKQLLQAFFDADVIDIELLFDNAMLAVNYMMAKEIGVKYIMSGSNQATEGIRTPDGWNWFKKDKRNIYDIAKKNGNVQIRSFPTIGILQYVYDTYIKGIKWVSFLDLTNFNKEEALNVLKQDYAYEPYAYKHYESILTRFYQGHILPEKFNVDKRTLHLSVLVASGQMDKAEALQIMQSSPYPSQQQLEEDKEEFLKRMGWSATMLETYLRKEPVSHAAYKNEKKWWDLMRKIRFILN